jgi:hypothetical protein
MNEYGLHLTFHIYTYLMILCIDIAIRSSFTALSSRALTALRRNSITIIMIMIYKYCPLHPTLYMYNAFHVMLHRISQTGILSLK